jgi:dihydroorotate dehydrogenase electron transfer subunit
VSTRRAGIVEGRRDGDGPVLATCEVLARRREGAYWLLSLAARTIAERARPGQFVNIAVEAPGTLLRRPFSIARVSRQGIAAGTIEVVFDAHGPGTEWLTHVDLHDVIDVVGPLGNPFPLPQRKVSCLLIGGGYGARRCSSWRRTAPQGPAGRHDHRRGSQDRIPNAIEAKRITASVTFTTDDGSYGTHGRVTDVLDEVVEKCGSGVVYACGPNPMLRAVSERCEALDLPVQVAVEEKMACGIGVCFTCVLPISSTGPAGHHEAGLRGRAGLQRGPDRLGAEPLRPTGADPGRADDAPGARTSSGDRPRSGGSHERGAADRRQASTPRRPTPARGRRGRRRPAVDLAGMKLPNPILTASGCFAPARRSTASTTSPSWARSW